MAGQEQLQGPAVSAPGGVGQDLVGGAFPGSQVATLGSISAMRNLREPSGRAVIHTST